MLLFTLKIKKEDGWHQLFPMKDRSVIKHIENLDLFFGVCESATFCMDYPSLCVDDSPTLFIADFLHFVRHLCYYYERYFSPVKSLFFRG